MAKRLSPTNSDDEFFDHSGDSGSRFKEIFNKHYDAIVLYTYRIIEDQAAAEDIVSEIFINLWKKNESFNQVHSIKSYLYISARNRGLTWIRKNQREKEKMSVAAALEELSERPVIDNLIYAETMNRVYAAIDLLPNQCRRVFIMHYIEGKKITEIAAELKISVSSVRTHKGRGIELLRKGLLCLIIWLAFNWN